MGRADVFEPDRASGRGYGTQVDGGPVGRRGRDEAGADGRDGALAARGAVGRGRQGRLVQPLDDGAGGERAVHREEGEDDLAADRDTRDDLPVLAVVLRLILLLVDTTREAKLAGARRLEVGVPTDL